MLNKVYVRTYVRLYVRMCVCVCVCVYVCKYVCIINKVNFTRMKAMYNTVRQLIER